MGGQAVLVREVGEGKSFARLEAQSDDTVLRADGDSYDATRIVVRALDTLGGLCPFCAAGLRIETEGPVQVIGPDTVALIGGCIAFWVRTCGKAGPARVRNQQRERNTGNPPGRPLGGRRPARRSGSRDGPLFRAVTRRRAAHKEQGKQRSPKARKSKG